jgi:hypothetical protein
VESATKSNEFDQSDAHGPSPKVEESEQQPLIGLHQDQNPTESANEAAQPRDPAPTDEVPTESQTDATFQEPQSTISIIRCLARQTA